MVCQPNGTKQDCDHVHVSAKLGSLHCYQLLGMYAGWAERVNFSSRRRSSCLGKKVHIAAFGKRSNWGSISHSLCIKQVIICMYYSILVRPCQKSVLNTEINWGYFWCNTSHAHLRLYNIWKNKLKLWRKWVKLTPLLQLKRIAASGTVDLFFSSLFFFSSLPHRFICFSQFCSSVHNSNWPPT